MSISNGKPQSIAYFVHEFFFYHNVQIDKLEMHTYIEYNWQLQSAKFIII